MKKFYQIGNIIFFILTVFINYISNTGVINSRTIGDVSHSLPTLITPAGYAFAIWGFIYLLVFGFVIYQARSLFSKTAEDDFVLKIGPWFIISCIVNALWVISFLYGYTALSCVFIFLILFSLVKIILNNRMEVWDAPVKTIVFLWWPFAFYAGWVTVASIVNVSAYLVKINWEGFGISPQIWAVAMLVIATAINLIAIYTRFLREFAASAIWALIAIAQPNLASHPLVAYTAFATATILLFAIFIQGFQNRKSNPFYLMLFKK